MGDKSESLEIIFEKIDAISICDDCKIRVVNIFAELRAGLESRLIESGSFTQDEINIMIDSILYTLLEDTTISFVCYIMETLDGLKDSV